MPGCGHVFDRACITNSLGVEYTCPECKNTYLLPSPYRPFQLSDRKEFIEYKELHRHLMQANQVIAQLQENLVKAYEELDLEQRSRKKSNESLVILSQQLVALQEKQTNLNSNEIGHLAVAGVPDDRSSMNADQGPSEIEATSSPTTPMPTEPTKKVPEEGAVDKKPEDTREKLLVHYNNRILKHKDVISKLSASLKKAKEMDDSASEEEKQSKFKVYVDKIFDLEKAAKLSNTYNLLDLKTTYKEYDERLPNESQMRAYSTVSKKLARVKAKNANLNRIINAMKREKLQMKLEHTLTESRRFIETIASHATIIEQAEQMNRELEAFLDE
ncbi:hypothetical protein MUCCIDRAFT_116150 [Mucor lusitanicus CBS 277.49]|uniref:RING-type domain-containing protein n=1 Tax=Mucor lusitanicus CBS 277.49 TaxID=747725 RepID=A0A168GGH0_MUCCL|nr:hypothetical protein MUCCIDRAFT_116150 [Mucor lusitanicus CBS 277.49]